MEIDAATLHDGHGWREFYGTLDSSSPPTVDHDTAIKAFKAAIASAYGNGAAFEQVSFIAAFLHMAKGFDDGLPTHYPRARQEGQANLVPAHPEGQAYEWFVANDRTGRRVGRASAYPTWRTIQGYQCSMPLIRISLHLQKADTPVTRPILLCTVGTSLFYPNLAGLRKTLAEDHDKPDDRKTIAPALVPAAERLADAFAAKDWPLVADVLAEIPANHRSCGAEVNSIASLIEHDFAPANAGIFFFHSDTDDGREIADVLVRLFPRGNDPVEAIPVPDLQDKDPKRFRTKGLRNLARLLCGKVRERSASACAINATGGYKAQIAVAVLLGQALGIPVYYMHERFSEIIAFPPMPVSLDYEVWLRFSGWLSKLEKDFVLRSAIEEDGWDERYESLVDSDRDAAGQEVLSLSATGQIFHETFRERFRTDRDRVLPPPAERGRNCRRSCTITRLSTCCAKNCAGIWSPSPRCPR